MNRKFLFACLYLSEGAPIGYIWLALPTRLRSDGVAIEQIAWLTALLVLPWTFKFAFAPIVDLGTTRHWTIKHWIVSAQFIMGLTLMPLFWLDPDRQFQTLAQVLLVHAVAAAIQDVSIDSYCIRSTNVGERGQINGWMQVGMLLGRASMGGGGLVLAQYVGDEAVVAILIGLTTFSALLVVGARPPDDRRHGWNSRAEIWNACVLALSSRNTWIGLVFAVIGGATFKSLEVIYGPYLVDRGFDESTIGWFSMGPMIGCMILGSVIGGRCSERIGTRKCVAATLLLVCFGTTTLGMVEMVLGPSIGSVALVLLALVAVGIGMFTASSYAMFMDLTYPAIAALQFSAFMGATNGCESWSTYVSGQLIHKYSYGVSILTMSAVSLAAIPLVLLISSGPSSATTDAPDDNPPP